MKEIVVKNRSLIQHINENDNILISKKRKQEIFDTTKDRVDVILYDNQENLLSKKSNIVLNYTLQNVNLNYFGVK